MNIEVKNLVKYYEKINKNQYNTRKRSREEDFSYDTIYQTCRINANNRLRDSGNNFLNLKGKNLSNYVNGFEQIFKEMIPQIKKEEQFNKEFLPEEKLKILAEISVSIDLLNEIGEYIKKNKNKTFSDCLLYFKNIDNENTYYFTCDDCCDSDNSSDSEYYEQSNNSDNEQSNNSDNEESEYVNYNKKIKWESDDNEFMNQLFKIDSNNYKDISKYYSDLSNDNKKTAIEQIKDINNFESNVIPTIFKIMNYPLDISQKNHIYKQYKTTIEGDRPDDKLKLWFDSLMRIPFGVYKGVSFESIKPTKIKKFLNNLQETMDSAVYGHDEAKKQIVQMIGQEIRNPKAKGNVLGIWGVCGNGKTSLIKDGICKAMDRPFIFISLGGATHASFLNGHSYTYEGSIYGRIVNGLISSKCMNPVIYFDELDKISQTKEGDEITNILIHLTDPVQNKEFRDNYFHGIDIDLSRATIIFSFNDPSHVNHVLLDRITTIETKFLMMSQKIHISKNYLLPNILKDIGLKPDDISFDDNVIKFIADTYTNEGGIRKLKSILYNIIREINLASLTKTTFNERNIVFPFKISIDDAKFILKNEIENSFDKIYNEPKIGFVNGLYATSSGVGGTIPIQIVWIPTLKPLTIKATGNLQQVMQESASVACSLVWNYLTDECKQNYITMWNTKPMGFHIHCPDGTTPKDGPSAGAALSLVIYSLFTEKKIRNNIAMTGEIDLIGTVRAIGGLEEKLEGAKRAGINMVLVPKDNIKDLEKIKKRNPTLLSDSFKINIIETFDDVLKYSLI